MDIWQLKCYKQSNTTVVLFSEMLSPATTYAASDHVSQHEPARDILWDTTQASSCFAELAWICAQLEVAARCSAQVNSYCLGHDCLLAVLFVGILFHCSHDTTAPTSREQGDRRTVRLQLRVPNNQQHMTLHCAARTPTLNTDLLCHAVRHFGARNTQHRAVQLDALF